MSGKFNISISLLTIFYLYLFFFRMEVTKRTATYRAQAPISNVSPVDVASSTHGSVMVTLTVKTRRMRIQLFVVRSFFSTNRSKLSQLNFQITEHVMLTPNLHAKTDVAFQNYGCVTLIMIVVCKSFSCI